MDGSPVLRQQSRNTIRSEIFRTKGEQNKLTIGSKSSKALSLHPLLLNLENQDPGSSGQVRPPHERPGVSRLPVLAKSLHLQNSNEFNVAHSKWEEKPLAGKVRTKKPSTRPVPFNFSQPKSTRVASENQYSTAIHPTRTSKLNNISSSQIKTTNRNSKFSGTLPENAKSIKSSENTSQPLGHSRPSHKTSVTVPKPVSCAPNSREKRADATEKLSASEICSKNMTLLSLKDTSSITKSTPWALQSILKNEGVKAKTSSHTVCTKSCYSSMKKVQFSPNAAALQSVLQNEGVKADGPVGATPRNSVCPAGRSTSISTAQRVLVKKNPDEPSPGRAVAARIQTPVQKWTPQRVTRPMSGMVSGLFMHCPSIKILVCTFLRRLFFFFIQCKGEMQSPKAKEKEEDGLLKEKEPVMRPFIQNPERESVIFFSTGKKLFRDPPFKKPEASDNEQHNPEDTLQQSWQISATIETETKAVAMLRKRLPHLGELRLDEEVATYTSVPVPPFLGFHTPRPHCGNPIATILHFEESARYLPMHLCSETRV
uniref:Uncharacterized protein n=1 Tax=Neogobius melanostomus TaxID=47308 RepID=A0A8C6TZW1_9GOBI